MSTKDSAPELSETRLAKLNSTKRLMKRLLFVLDFRLDETLRDVMLVSSGLIFVSFPFSFPGQIMWSDGKAVVAETDIEELGILAKFKISHDIKDLNAAGDGGADK